MVVLAAAICTKNGKPLLSRQFTEITKSRIEGLLSAFPKLIGNGKQHTFIETENIRYVYQPLESLYLVLITNKNSNILEDLETLSLLAKLVQEYSTFDESEVSRKAFDIIFTFDEVIAMGYKERVTVQQIKHFISMESHEEERARMEQLMREKDAKEIANRKAKDFEKQRQESIMRGGNGRIGGGIGSGMGGGMGSGGMSPSPYGGGSSGGMGGGMGGYDNSSPLLDKRESSTPPSSKPSVPMKEGMKLGMKTSKKSAIAQVLKEEKVVEKEEELEALLDSTGGANTSSSGGSSQSGGFTNAVPQEGVHIIIEEQFTANIENDGTVGGIDIKGGMSVNVNDNSLGRIKVALQQGPKSRQFQFVTHPNIDKTAFQQNSVIRLRDGQKTYPSGGIFKWRCKNTDDSMIPIKVNCWPSPSGQNTTVNLEYESTVDFPLKNVVILIPNPSGGVPTIGHFDGMYEYDGKQKQIQWRIPLIDDQNKQGSMEFSIKGKSNNFFPVKVNFTSNKTLCDINIEEVINEDSGNPTKFSTEVTLLADNYEII